MDAGPSACRELPPRFGGSNDPGKQHGSEALARARSDGINYAIIFNKAHQSNEAAQMRDTFYALTVQGSDQIGTGKQLMGGRLMALTDGFRHCTIPSAAQGMSGPCADLANP
jgi:hypothetical protein